MKLEDIGFYTLNDERAKCSCSTSNMKRGEIILTDKCNFKCLYCRGIREDCSGVMELISVKNTIDIWSTDHLENIRFSGGEPTLYPYIKDVVSYAKLKGIKRIAISTNGYSNLNFYKELIALGVNDFSISLDSCCSSVGDKMNGGINGAWKKTVENIKALSKLTYVTVGMVFTEDNWENTVDSIIFADSLGVSDIRIVSSAQNNNLLEQLSMIPKDVLDRNPILTYRVDNYLNGRNIRGISVNDYNKCPLVLDDSAVAGEYHFPCIIYLREKGNPIGKVNKNMRQERKEWFLKHDAYADKICRKNCLDVCIDYNNKFFDYHKKINLRNLGSSHFTMEKWRSDNIHSIVPKCRYKYIVSNDGREALKRYAVGWCDASNVPFKQKLGEVAIMCFKDNSHFWFHIRKNEFISVFSSI